MQLTVRRGYATAAVEAAAVPGLLTEAPQLCLTRQWKSKRTLIQEATQACTLLTLGKDT